MFGASLLARPAILIGVSAGLFIGGCLSGYFYKAKQEKGAIAVAVAKVHKAEADCLEGSACAAATDLRAAQDTALVNAAVAEADLARAAQVAELERRLAAAEAAGDRQARGLLARLRSAEARSLAAAQSSQECALWSAQPVPCPLSQ